MVSDQHHPLQPRRLAGLLLLEEHRDEGLDFEDLSSLFHDEGVELEARLHKVMPLQCRVRARHGDDLGLRRHEVLGALLVRAQDLERTALVQEREHVLEVAEAALGSAHSLLEAHALLEDRLRRVREEVRKRKLQDHCSRVLALLHLVLELLPPGEDVEEVEVLCCLARVVHVRYDAQALGEPPDFRQELDTLLEHELDAAVLAEVLLGLELVCVVSEAQQMPLVDVQRRNLLENVVERLVRVRDEEHALVREVVVDVGHDLHGRVCLSRSRRPDNLRQPLVRPRQDR
mmetsp:Transcript_50897/g.120481  ORF Transcript_50897/g.120481 Transcript_50897/m.120481 type:complete len:288 (-) Transcript_50897:2385-3248(-)